MPPWGHFSKKLDAKMNYFFLRRVAFFAAGFRLVVRFAVFRVVFFAALRTDFFAADFFFAAGRRFAAVLRAVFFFAGISCETYKILFLKILCKPF